MKKIIGVFILVFILFFSACGVLVNNDKESINNNDGINSNGEKVKNDSEISNIHEMKDVIFLNDLPNMETLDVDYPEDSFHELRSEYDYSANADKLFAFVIFSAGMQYEDYPSDYPVQQENESIQDFLLREYEYILPKVVETIKDAGLYIISDYPFVSYNQESVFPTYIDAYRCTDKIYFGLCAVVGTYSEVKEIFATDSAINGWCFEVFSAPRPDFLEIMSEAGWNSDEINSSSLEYPWDWYYNKGALLEPLLGEENQVIMSVEVE